MKILSLGEKLAASCRESLDSFFDGDESRGNDP